VGPSISYGIVKKQGGRIDVQTEIGKGLFIQSRAAQAFAGSVGVIERGD